MIGFKQIEFFDHTGLFNVVSQQKKGSFCGVEEGRQILKTLIEKTNWDSEESVFEFANDIVARLQAGYRQSKPQPVSVNDQLKKGSAVELYDFLFSFEYLKPKYNLLLGGRDLDELSPGERGTLLLLFYVLVDTSSNPLVIDQPEANLDNQTVFNALVPAIKEARKRRQIVIVTHNPNLAVVCDADQVIYAHLDKKDANKVTYDCGSIENPAINRRIIDVLEGTRPAFDNRDSKYQEPPSLDVTGNLCPSSPNPSRFMIFIMIERFVQLLIEATARVAEPYFLLPVAGKEDPIYRERVSCYELYHQLRLLLENEPALSRYALSGEIDKQGHPLIRQFAPDFVFHAPGQMDDNLLVVEVKPVNAATEGIRKDLETLEYFLSEPIGYKLGVQLVYRDDENALFRFRELHHGAGLPNVQLLWHRHSGQHATLIR